MWDIENGKLIMDRNVIFNEKSVLVRTKMLEISDAEADNGRIDDNNNGNAMSQQSSFDYSTNDDCTGGFNGGMHSNNSDGKKVFKSEFEMTDIGKVDTFLGICIEHDEERQTISMSQKSYLEKMLQKFSMGDCEGVYSVHTNGK